MKVAALVLVFSIVLPYVALHYFHLLGPTPLGYINVLYPASPYPIKLNPEADLPFVTVLRQSYEVFRDEFMSKLEKVSRPRASFYSKEFPGAIRDANELEGWRTTYLRLGTADTCLTRHFPKTMEILDGKLGIRVHSVFFSLLDSGKETIAPHCGQLSGLWRVITVLSGEKNSSAPSLAVQYGYEDYSMCRTRFSADCPSHMFDDLSDPKIHTVHYNAGDVFVFNDFTCHAVRNYAKGKRLVMVINVDRPDLPWLSNFLTAWGSWIFSRKSLGIFREQSLKICEALTEDRNES